MSGCFNPSDLSPFFQQRLPVGHQQLSVIQLRPLHGRVLQCMLVAEGHLVGGRHVHQTGGVVLGGRAESPVHHVIEADEGLRLSAGGGGAGRDIVTHQVHQIGGLGGVGWRLGAAVPQVDQAVRPGVPHVEAGGVAGLRGDALHRLGRCGLLDGRLLLRLRHRI